MVILIIGMLTMFVCAAKCDISWVDNRPFTINTKTIIMSSMFMKVFHMLGLDTEYLMLMVMILGGCQSALTHKCVTFVVPTAVELMVNNICCCSTAQTPHFSFYKV